MHFLLVAIVPSDNIPQLETRLEQRLAPFSEDYELPLHQQECWCLKWHRRDVATRAAAARLGTDMEQLREQFHALPEPKPEWEAYVKPFHTAVQEELQKLAPMADPECSTCEGTGVYQTTSNPHGYWDWYQVGGRWTGVFDKDYDPSADPRNRETCYLCHGTGKRTDMIVANGCDVCAGTGVALKWPSDWAPAFGNIVPTELASGSDVVPNSILTPEGDWFTRETYTEPVTYGTDAYLQATEAWDKLAKELFDKYPDHIAVVVDCHI